MFLIRVIPLARLPAHAPSVLDYFWPSPLVAGALVRTQMGKRTLNALVIDSIDVRTAKTALKRSSFSLKKLSAVITEIPQLSTAQLELARWIATQYACSLSTAVSAVTPSFIGKRNTFHDHSVVPAPAASAAMAGAAYVTQRDTAISVLNELASSGKGQLLILVPEHALIDALSAHLPSSVRRCHSGMPQKEYRTLYNGILDGTVRAVIGTRTALFLPWSSLSHVVVEDPLNELYKSDMAPRLNAADTARQLASMHDAKLVWLTTALSTVQHHLKTAGTLPVSVKKLQWPEVTIATLQSEQESGNRLLFSRAAQESLLDAYDRNAPVLIYSARKGYSTVARCSRCRAHVACGTCGNPMRWHRTTEDMLVCYHCAACSTVPLQCPSCHAGVLKPSGTPGSQKIAESVSLMLDRFGYSGINIPVLDSDLIQSEADSRRIFAQFDSMKQPMMVATSMIFGHRYSRRFETIIIPHLDMLSSNPDYRTGDRLILQLEKLADFMPSRLIVQCSADEPLANLIPDRNWNAYYASELPLRKALRWPPYSRIVKLMYTHRDKGASSRAAATAAGHLNRVIAHLKAPGTKIIGPVPALIERVRGKWVHHIIIKSSLPSAKLADLLHYVPEGWSIDVDPRSIT